MHRSVRSHRVRIFTVVAMLALISAALLSFSLTSYAASPKVTVGSAESTDSNGNYAITVTMTDISLSAKKSIDVGIIYNNMAFSIVKTEIASSLEKYTSVGKTGDNPYHIKISASSSTLKPSGTVCTIYFEPIGIPEVKDYVIRASVSGDVSASAVNGEIQVKCAHVYAKESTVDPNCTSGGYTLEKCTKCGGYRQSNKTSPIGHKYEEKGTVAPNCEKDGYTVMECSRCGHRDLREGEKALGHEYGIGASRIVEPTCSSKGYTEYDCLRDGCTYSLKTDYTDTVDHVRGETVTVNSTCQKHGSRSVYCEHCGCCLEEERLEIVPHKFTDTVVPPTCTSKGYTLRVCDACNTTRRENSVAMAEHNYTEIIERPSDCTSAGRKKYLCICGDSYTEEIEAHGHDYVKESVIDATEESDGMINYVCSVCGDTTLRIIPAGSTGSGNSSDKKEPVGLSDEKKETVFVNRLVLNVMFFLATVLVVVLIFIIIKALVREIIFIRKRKRT
ncbi:MAG: hypothetical protein IJZ03_05780 [Clostridia bacterium]|nr:hypothetical protein [Clostridia bacterium]